MRDVATLSSFVHPLPEADGYTPLLAREESVGMRSGLVVLQPGESSGWHSTDEYEELIICLSGRGMVEVERNDGRNVDGSDLPAGHYAYNPPRTRHNVTNNGTEVMRYIYVVAPVTTP